MFYLLDISCGDLKDILGFINNIILLFQIAIPIILIVMGMVDLGKAVMASKDDEIKKAQMTLVKRAIAAVMVFFVIAIVKLLLGLLPGTEGVVKCIQEYIR